MKANIIGTHGCEPIGPGSSQICENEVLTNLNFGSLITTGHHIFDLGMDEGTDIFILKDVEGTEYDVDENRSSNFKIESVVGVKYIGVKPMTVKAGKIYDWVLEQNRPYPPQTDLEKDSELSDELGVFNPATGAKFKFKNEDIQMRTKRVVSRMDQELTEDKLEIADDDTGLGQRLKDVAENSRRSESMVNQRTRHKSLTTIIREEPQRTGEIEFKEESNVLQIGDPEKNLSRRELKRADETGQRSKTQGGLKKRSKSILKNSNQNQNLE